MSFTDLRAKRAARQQHRKFNNPDAYVQPAADSDGGLDSNRMNVDDSSIPVDSNKVLLQDEQSEQHSRGTVSPARAPLSSGIQNALTAKLTQPLASTSRSSLPSSFVDLEKNGLYNDIPHFLSLKKSSISGRGLYAEQTIKAGLSLPFC